MRILITFVGLSFDGVESFKGGFYVNAVSLDNAHNKATKILFTVGVEPELLGCFNELSDDFNEWPLDTFKGLNGAVKCTGQYVSGASTGNKFERAIMVERGKLVGTTDLYESEAQCIKYL